MCKEEYLSAVGLEITINQGEAIIDHTSVKPYFPLTKIDDFHYVCPKLGRDEEILLRFDAYYTGESKEINAGEISVAYLDREGENSSSCVIKTNFSSPCGTLKKELTMARRYNIILLIAMMFIAVMWIYLGLQYRRLKTDIEGDISRADGVIELNKSRIDNGIYNQLKEIFNRIKERLKKKR